ncbi:MAG: hypothetical protein JEZ11_04670 [Desulfobacterales bacterium]|nr:hypothetical protein [Desulfobacterales bacterium]
MTNAPNHEDNLDWENRRLCIDGNCIGVIGPDGRCKECGKPSGDDLAPPSPPASPPVTDNEPVEADPESPPPPQETMDGKPEPVEIEDIPESGVDVEDIPENDVDVEWKNRRLCANGNCIGVIGPDGLCKECGEPAGEGDDD